MAQSPPPLPEEDETLLRQEAVRRAIRHAWGGYTRYARGTDDLKPVSRSGEEGLCKMGVTAVDSLDTLILAELPEEYADARDWVLKSLSFGREDQEDINVFETMIRVVGGLLGAHELSGDARMLDLATDLARRLVTAAFQDGHGLPRGTVGLRSGKSYNPAWVGGASSTSEVGTLQLELTYIARKTGQSDLEDLALGAIRHLRRLNVTDGLYPIYVHPGTGLLMAAPVTLGARGDSLYEYLLKLPLLFHPERSAADRRAVDWVGGMYARSARGVLDRLLLHSAASGMPYLAEQSRPVMMLKPQQSPQLVHKMDHLVCFAPGMLALGALHGLGFEPGADVPESGFFRGVEGWDGDRGARARLLNISRSLVDTCLAMYDTTTTRLAPEIVTFYSSGLEMRPNHDARHCLLRPETVESLFVLWRATHDQRLRDAAWSIFTALERNARVWSGGYSSLHDADWGKTLPVPTALPTPDGDGDAASRAWPWPVEEVRRGNDAWGKRCSGDSAPTWCAQRCDDAEEEGQAAPADAAAVAADPPVFEPDSDGPRDTRNMRDHMESFFMAETLKYLLLIFSDDSVLPLDQYVLNTEAHPLGVL